MIIENVQIAGFGGLSGEYIFSGGLNLILAANEAGKTTLAEAMVAILYGVRSVGRRGTAGAVFSRDYTPVSAESFSGSAVVCTDSGRRLNIWRDFAQNRLRVLELASGRDITGEFASPPNGDCLGEQLTGLSIQQYCKLAMLGQDELNKNWDFVEFVDSLSVIFSTGNNEGVSLEEAKAVLEESINGYAGITGKGRLRVDTEIKRLRERKTAIADEIAELAAAYAEIEHRFAEAADRRLAADKIRTLITKYDYFICLRQRQELEKRLSSARDARKEVLTLEAERDRLAGIKEFEFAGIEDIAELLALYSDKNERISDIRSLKETRCGELEYLEKRVANLGKRANITQEYLQKIEQAAAVLESNIARERSVRIDCRSAESLLQEVGVGAEEVRKFREWEEGSKAVEVEFVLKYTAIREQIANKEQGLHNARQEQVGILRDVESARDYRYRFSRNNLILGCVFTGLSVFFFVAMGFLPFMLVPAVLCLSWAVFGAVRLVGVQKTGSAEEAAATAEISRIEDHLGGFTDKYVKMEEKFAGFAGNMGFSSEQLLDLVARMSKARKEVDGWLQRIGRHKTITETIDESYAVLQKIFCELGIADAATRLDLPRVRVFMREVSDALSLIEQHDGVREKQDELTAQELELLGEIHELTAELEDIFARAGVEVMGNDFAKAMGTFKERLQVFSELQTIEEVSLPQAIKSAGEVDDIGALEQEIETWSGRIERMLRDNPWLEAEEPEAGIAEYGQEIKLARLRLEDCEGEVAEREKSLAIEDSRRKERLPLLQDEEARVNLALHKAERFAQATSRALQIFESISSELHQRWSPLFSEEFNQYTGRFSTELEFSLSKDLKICAVLRENGAPIANDRIAEYLSRGMRDQVYLSLRLLLLQKVARNENLPIILDDPFVNADDQRFAEGMQQLLELAGQSQIFIFSCHELRHRKLCTERSEFATGMQQL